MTFERSPLFPLTFLSFTLLLVNACSSSNSGDDDSSNAGKGAVLSGGTTGNGGTNGSGASGGTTDMGGTGGSTGGTGTGGKGGSAGSAGSLAGGGGTTASGGKGGAGGTTASGGTTGGTASGTGGSSGTSTTTTGGALGASCKADADCTKGLTCITTDSQTLGGAGPPGGLCTTACTADTDCTAFSSGSYCVAFDTQSTITYCLEGCTTGAAGSPKCGERPDFACNLLGVMDTTKTCTSTADCGSRQICDPSVTPNVCGDTVTGCLPSCRGDFDCSSGQYCDFLSGMCTQGQDTGQAIGTSCDPNATTDPCNGFCSAVDSAGKIGECAGFCSLNSDLTGCGWDGTTKATAGCLFGTALSPMNDLAQGDVGICGALCDCNTDCTIQTEYCVDDSMGAVQKIWGRAGYCRPLLTTETSADSIACK
jgi:hypothetical protein